MSSNAILVQAGLRSRKHTFGPGDAIFHLGDAVRWMHFVQLGTIHLIRDQKSGTQLVLQRAIAGDILAEASLYSAHYHCGARVVTEAFTLAVSRSELVNRLATDVALAQAWARHLAREVHRARLQSEVVALRTVAARLDAWLTWNGPMPPKGHWGAMAAEIGVSPEALYREIAKRRT